MPDAVELFVIAGAALAAEAARQQGTVAENAARAGDFGPTVAAGRSENVEA